MTSTRVNCLPLVLKLVEQKDIETDDLLICTSVYQKLQTKKMEYETLPGVDIPEDSSKVTPVMLDIHNGLVQGKTLDEARIDFMFGAGNGK